MHQLMAANIMIGGHMICILEDALTVGKQSMCTSTTVYCNERLGKALVDTYSGLVTHYASTCCLQAAYSATATLLLFV